MASLGDQLIVDAAWLAKNRSNRHLVLVDTRPATDYWKGHLAGARHFDPFPFHFDYTTEKRLKEFVGQLEWIFSQLGITAEDDVIFYENDSGMRAARCVWLLRYAGHGSAAMLDGGLRAVPNEKLSAEASPIEAVYFKAAPQADILGSVDYVANHLGDHGVQIFDVRTRQEFFGELVRAKRGGAIPGSINLDWTAANDSRGLLKPAAELREMFAKLGLDPAREVVTYCQGGYRAAHSWIALKRAGFSRVRNYIGSWAEWGNREDLPIEQPKRR